MTPNQAHLRRTPPSQGLADLLARNGYTVPDNALDAVYIARALINFHHGNGWREHWQEYCT